MPTSFQIEAQCDDLGSEFTSTINSLYDERLRPLQTMIDEDLAKGSDPTKHTIAHGAITLIVNLYALKAEIEAVKSQALDIKDQKVASCKADGVPNFVGDVQKIVDIAVGIAALPLILLTKNYAAVNIDVGEVYKGRPLGGDGALIPHVRDEAFDYLRIGKDDPLRKFLADPFVDPFTTLQNIASAPGAIIGNVKDELNRAFEDLGLPFRL